MPSEIGARIHMHRQRAGMSRPVLAGLLDRSAEWLKKVEGGDLQPPRLPMLSRIAQVLHVDIGDLVVGLDIPEGSLSTGGHPALAAVRSAITHLPLGVDQAPQPIGHIAARVAAGWRIRHASPDHRTVLGGLLPSLIQDAQYTAHATTGPERRRAHAALAGVYCLTQMYVAYQPDAPLVWRVVDRAMLAAREADSPRALAAAAWLHVEAYREAGDWDTALSVGEQVIGYLQPTDEDLLGLLGALHAGVAVTAARAGSAGRAQRHLDQAERIARRVPGPQPQTWFAAPVVGHYAVAVALELRRPGEALQAARRLDPTTITSVPRRARHHLEVARAHWLRHQGRQALAELTAGASTAPETIAYSPVARRMVAEMVRDQGDRALRGQARDLALRMMMPLTG